jgi:putative membrane protein
MPALFSHPWPTFNAALNAACALLLTAGFLSIRRKNVPAHKLCMISAFGVSILFLISYLAYHARHGSTRFLGTGPVRPLYFAILISHTILAVVILPLALRTLYLAWRNRIAEHRRIARWTLPLWLYVSVTGVVVYWMLYQMRWP